MWPLQQQPTVAFDQARGHEADEGGCNGS